MDSTGIVGKIVRSQLNADIRRMRLWAFVSLGNLFLGSLFISTSLAQEAGSSAQETAFEDAILAVERRDYALLRSIVEENPSVLDHRTENGDDLFHAFRYVFHEDSDESFGISIDLDAIETLLDIGAVPSVSNGLIGSLLVKANDFGGEVEAFPVNSGQCTENREAFFPVINRLVEAGAEFGLLDVEIAGFKPSEAFFYQYQLCLSPFVCGGRYETPSKMVKRRVSASTTQAERDLLLVLAAEGSQDLDCLNALNNW